MANLNPLELGRLKSLLSGEALTIEEKLSTLDILRSRFPSFLSSLKPGLTEENLKDNNFLIKYLTNPYNRNKIKNALRNELSLSPTQQIDLEQALSERPVATGEVGGQPTNQGATPTIGQETQPAETAIGASVGSMPFGTPSATTSYNTPAPRRLVHDIPQAEKPDIAIANPPKIALADSSGAVTKEHTITSRRLNFSAFRSSVSSAFKKVQNFASPAGPFLKVSLGRIGRTAAGPGLTGVANLGGKTGLGLINHGGDFLSNLSNVRSRASAASSSISKNLSSGKKAALASGIFLAILLMGLVGGAFPGTTSTGEAAPINGSNPTGISDISSCKFTRAKDPQFIKSNLLLSYIQEASQKSSIPPVVLAAFIRVESPSSSNMSDDQISNYSTNCAKSPTGALGIMQIQPPGTTSARGDPASCDDCIDAGAKLVGKTVSTMATQDYCDPRTNITVGAGWILKKMSKLGYGDGTKWDPGWTNNKEAIKALVNTYYGCLDYGTTECAGPYNYADDVSTSIQNCQTQSTTAGKYTPGGGGGIVSCPINNGATTTGSKETGGHCSPTYGFDCIPPGQTGYTGRETAVDIRGPDRMVFLPYLSGNSVMWTIDESSTVINDAEGGGIAVAATASSEGKQYRIRFVHIDSTDLKVGQTAKSAAPVGQHVIPSAEKKSFANHVHITLQEDGIYKPADLYFNLCR